jgi:hypothetical protein
MRNSNNDHEGIAKAPLIIHEKLVMLNIHII